MKTARHSQRGFTLLELLVVIAIMAILAALLFTAMSNARRNGQKTQSLNNLRQWGGAALASLGDFNGELPSSGGVNGTFDATDKDAWFNRLPRYISALPLNDANAQNTVGVYGEKSLWINPAISREEYAKHHQPPGSWFFSYALNGWLSTTTRSTTNVNNITSPMATVLMCEKGDNLPSAQPAEIHAVFGPGDVLTGKENAAHFVFCDGHIELMRRDVFDPAFSTVTPTAVDNTTLNPSFTFVPFVGAEL